MCGTAIRYEHILWHPESEQLVTAGEVCASHLVEEYVLKVSKARSKRAKRNKLTSPIGQQTRRTRMALVTPNLDELASIEPGTYMVNIVECEVKTSKKGTEYLKWKFETVGCDEAKNNGQAIWTNTMITGKGAFRFKDLYSAAIGEDYDGTEAFDTDMLLGKEIRVGVVDGIDQQGNKSGYPEVKTFGRA
jgi:hypothetical protein